MNAAARVLTQSNLFRSEWYNITFSRQALSLAVLVSLMLSSAISLVYVKSLKQQYFSELQVLQQQADRSALEWHQLLAEQSTWAAPAHLQAVASQYLIMHVPPSHEIVMVPLNH